MFWLAVAFAACVFTGCSDGGGGSDSSGSGNIVGVWGGKYEFTRDGELRTLENGVVVNTARYILNGETVLVSNDGGNTWTASGITFQNGAVVDVNGERLDRTNSGGGNPGGGGGGSNNSIVGIWKAQLDNLLSNDECRYFLWEFIFNSDNTGLMFLQGECIREDGEYSTNGGGLPFNWRHSDGIVFFEGYGLIPHIFYNGGNTFTRQGITFMRTSNVGCVGNRPSAPTNVRITDVYEGQRTITISWNAVAGARTYLVYESETPNGLFFPTETTEGIGTIETSTQLYIQQGRSRYFRITAINNCGESVPSAVINFTSPQRQ